MDSQAWVPSNVDWPVSCVSSVRTYFLKHRLLTGSLFIALLLRSVEGLALLKCLEVQREKNWADEESGHLPLLYHLPLTNDRWFQFGVKNTAVWEDADCLLSMKPLQISYHPPCLILSYCKNSYRSVSCCSKLFVSYVDWCEFLKPWNLPFI